MLMIEHESADVTSVAEAQEIPRQGDAANKTNATETEIARFEFVELFNIDSKHKEKLNEAITATNGTIEIWVHTHYVGDFDPITQEEIGKFNAYQDKRERFIQQAHEGRMPVIAMIDSNPQIDTDNEIIEDYKNFYGDLNTKDKESSIFFVRTFDGHSVPCLKNQQDYAVLQEDTRIENWNALGQTLADLGVKNVIIRGRNFAMEERDVNKLDTAYSIYKEKYAIDIEQNDSSNVLMPSRCVGDAMVNLDVRGFKILKSQLTYPETIRH